MSQSLNCEMCETAPAVRNNFFCNECLPLAEQFIAENKAEFDKKHLITFEITVRLNGRFLTFKISGYRLDEIKANVNTVLAGNDLQALIGQ